jgi:hypothetical protein
LQVLALLVVIFAGIVYLGKREILRAFPFESSYKIFFEKNEMKLIFKNFFSLLAAGNIDNWEEPLQVVLMIMSFDILLAIP